MTRENIGVVLENGKYHFYVDEITGNFLCKRYDSPWRCLAGDKAVYSLFMALIDELDKNKTSHPSREGKGTE